MLVLSRKIGESLFLGDDIQITILDHQGSKVRIGVKAPKNVSVHREEIYLKIKKDLQIEIENQCDE